MFIAIIIAIAVGFAAISLFGGVLKKIMEIVSTLLRLGLGGIISMLICKAVGVDFSNQGRLFLYCAIGAFVIFALIAVLASMFRMIGYSINFFTISLFIGCVTAIFQNKIPMHWALLAAVLFLLPRILWISDRAATTEDYMGSDYDPWMNTRTYFYAISPMDWWGNSDESWKWLPFQIIVSSLFYLIGSATLFSFFPLPNKFLDVVCGIAAIAVNVLFDMFVFRKIEEHYFD